MKAILKNETGFVVADVGEVYTLAQYIDEVHGAMTPEKLYAHFLEIATPRMKALVKLKETFRRKHKATGERYFRDPEYLALREKLPAGSPVPLFSLGVVKKYQKIGDYLRSERGYLHGQEVVDALIIVTGDKFLKEAREVIK